MGQLLGGKGEITIQPPKLNAKSSDPQGQFGAARLGRRPRASPLLSPALALSQLVSNSGQLLGELPKPRLHAGSLFR